MSERSNALYRERYGQWAGNNAGSPPDYTRCCADVWPPPGHISSQCSRKRGHGPDGAYCKQHDPAEVKRRQEEASARYERDMARRRLGFDGRRFRDALRQIAKGHNDPRALAVEVLGDMLEEADD